MGMFDYKHYSSDEAAALAITARDLAVYTNADTFYRLPGDEILNGVGKIAKDFLSNDVHVAAPAGWHELEPKDLGLPDSVKDKYGYLTFESPFLGHVDNGPQAKVFAQQDAGGNITKVAVGWCGTNGFVDVIDYFGMNNNKVAGPMQPLLEAVKAYAEGKGLSGEDVLITGYSLGGGLVNVMAENRADLADGFFSKSDYIGVESPEIFDDPNVVLNIGFENDAVYRIVGDHSNFLDTIKENGIAFMNQNHEYQTTMDNFVLYNDVYASKLWNIAPFSLFNIPTGWYAHMDGVISDAVARVAHSTFYDLTVRDSTVIVSSLTALSRGIRWVEDKDCATSSHYGTPAFLIGTKHADLIRGGSNSDYIDAGDGDDVIEVGRGQDRVDGGNGVDDLRLVGNSDDWNVYRMSDDTMFFAGEGNANIVEASNIEKVSFTGEALSWTRHYEIGDDALIDHRFKLFSFINSNETYKQAHEGSEGDDIIHDTHGAVFARAGDDIIIARDDGSLLHGGEGNDVLITGKGNDRLYGAEGNDILIVTGGENILSGGIGHDHFIFESEVKGEQTITDFNQFIQDQDQLTFAKNLFDDDAVVGNTLDLAKVGEQVDNDAYISGNDFSVTILNCQLGDLEGCIHFI